MLIGFRLIYGKVWPNSLLIVSKVIHYINIIVHDVKLIILPFQTIHYQNYRIDTFYAITFESKPFKWILPVYNHQCMCDEYETAFTQNMMHLLGLIQLAVAI